MSLCAKFDKITGKYVPFFDRRPYDLHENSCATYLKYWQLEPETAVQCDCSQAVYHFTVLYDIIIMCYCMQ